MSYTIICYCQKKFYDLWDTILAAFNCLQFQRPMFLRTMQNIGRFLRTMQIKKNGE